MVKKLKKSRFLTLGILCIALVMILYGYKRGEVQTVLIKATRICMECIGIG